MRWSPEGSQGPLARLCLPVPELREARREAVDGGEDKSPGGTGDGE